MEPRLEQYLSEHQLDAQKVVPLTGDASDRRYFRVLLKKARPIVLALHQGAIDFETMPFVAVVDGSYRASGSRRSHPRSRVRPRW